MKVYKKTKMKSHTLFYQSLSYLIYYRKELIQVIERIFQVL